MRAPGIQQTWTQLFHNNALLHLVQSGPLTEFCFKWKLILAHRSDDIATWNHFPQHEATRIYVDAQESIAIEIYGTFQHFGRHVTTCANLAMRLAAWLTRLEYHCQAKISNACCQISLKQYIFRLKVPMRYWGFQSFRLCAQYFLVQMRQAIGHGFGNATKLWPGYRVWLEIVAERAIMLICWN